MNSPVWVHPTTEVQYDPYDAYRECPLFHEKVNLIAKDEGIEPKRVLSKGMWTTPIKKRRLGMAGEGFV